jgi:alanyl-tRNA synthetase
VRLVSALPGELPAGIERLQADARETRRQLKDAQARLAGFEAAALAGRAAVHGDARVVVEALEGWDQGGLKTIASTIAARPGHIAVLFSTPSPSAVVIARADGSPFDSAAAMRQLIDEFGGKGGGRPDLAQGGGLQATPEALVAFARSFF